jgi:hypothetical protein
MVLTCADAKEPETPLWDDQAAFHYFQLLSPFAIFEDSYPPWSKPSNTS